MSGGRTRAWVVVAVSGSTRVSGTANAPASVGAVKAVVTTMQSRWQDFFAPCEQSLHGISQGCLVTLAVTFVVGIVGMQEAAAGATGATTSAAASAMRAIRLAMVDRFNIAFEAYYTLFGLEDR